CLDFPKDRVEGVKANRLVCPTLGPRFSFFQGVATRHKGSLKLTIGRLSNRPMALMTKQSIFILDRHTQCERAHPLPGVIRLLEELICEVRMAERTSLVEGVAEGDRAPVVPAGAHPLDGRVRLAIERQGQ